MRALSVLILSSIAALVVGGWCSYRAVSMPGAELLRYVPSDSAFFLGFSRPLPTPEIFAVWGKLLPPYSMGTPGFDAKEPAAPRGPAVGVLGGIEQQHRARLEKGEWPFTLYGFPRNGVMAAYLVGGAPVLRWQLTEPGALWKTLDIAEQAAGIHGQSESRGSLQLRRYAFDAGEHPPLELIFAAGDGFGLVTLHVAGSGQAALAEALGLQMPANPLALQQLDELAWAHGLLPGTAGFIDHQRLLAEFSGASGGRFDKIVAAILPVRGPTGELFSALHTAECRDDVNGITDTWPRTVLGVTDFDQQNGQLTERLMVETTNQGMLARLESLHGDAPTMVRSPRGLLSFSFAIDFSSLTSVFGGFRTQLTRTPYRCPVLIAAQRHLPAPNPVQRGIASALLADVKGIAGVLFRPQPANVPALPVPGAGVLVIATDRPEALWRMVQLLGSIDLEHPPRLNGEPVALHQLTRDQLIRVALREESLVVLIGDAQPPRRGREESGASTSNRLIGFHYHGGRATPANLTAIEHLPVRMSATTRQRIRGVLDDLQTTNIGWELSLGLGETGFNVDIAIVPTGVATNAVRTSTATGAKSLPRVDQPANSDAAESVKH